MEYKFSYFTDGKIDLERCLEHLIMDLKARQGLKMRKRKESWATQPEWKSH